jgi:DNA invertase Pin-like site-specific DNA recombinase
MKHSFIAYSRISTTHQLRDDNTSLGIEAQLEAITKFVDNNGGELIETFSDVQSGKSDTRTGLLEALALCKKEKATLVISKLDRLGRKASSLLAIKDSGVDIRVVDMPEMNKFMFSLHAILAEEEANKVSIRTKAALSVLKKKGVKLGNPDIVKHVHKSNKTNKDNADKFALKVAEEVEELKRFGIKTQTELVKGLKFKGIVSARGSNISQGTLSRILRRAETLKKAA